MKVLKRKKNKIKLKVGDLARVMAGDAKGKQAAIIKVDYSSNRAMLEGVNLVTKHKKPTAKNVKGSIVRLPAYIHISNLSFVEPKTGQLSKVGKKINPQIAKLARYSKKSGEFI